MSERGRRSNPQDPFERWAALQAWSSDASNRVDESTDLAFWERFADDYDRGTLAGRVPAVLQRVLDLVPHGASVLDVGTGTGAFALPIAAQAASVTALDYSPAMLRVLGKKLRAQPLVRNVHPVLARWEDADVPPHDVVFVANALYRAADLRRALTRIVETVVQRGIVVWSVGRQDPPQHAVREYAQAGRYRPGPDFIHLLDGLFALDVFAHVELIETDDTQHYVDARSAVEGLLSWQPIEAEQQSRAAALLARYLQRDGEGWTWPRRGRVAIIWWDRAPA